MSGINRNRPKLPHDVSKIIYVRNLPYKYSSDEMYDLFGKFGSIRQIRTGNAINTKGTCYVVFDDVYDAKTAVESLNGFNVGGRYLVAIYHQPAKQQAKRDLLSQKEEVEQLRRRLAAAAGAEEKKQ
jgi:pre-mRNA branch site protein p14